MGDVEQGSLSAGAEVVVATFRDRGTAEKAVGDLISAGFPATVLSVLASEDALRSGEAAQVAPVASEVQAAGDHVRNTLTGALEGSVMGLIAGVENLVLGSFVVPVVAMGPLTAYAAERLAGRSDRSVDLLHEGRIIVVLHAEDNDAAVRGQEILSASQPLDLQRRPEF